MRKALSRLTLRQLQVFRAVCESRSYSRAAEEMALSQPAVSLQMRQLEELLGQPLFDYQGRQLHLTAAAEALQAASRDLFARLARDFPGYALRRARQITARGVLKYRVDCRSESPAVRKVELYYSPDGKLLSQKTDD